MRKIYCGDWKNVHKKVNRFIDFCLKHSEFVVLTKRTSSVSKEILSQMAEEEIKSIKARRQRQLAYARQISEEELRRIDMKDKNALEKQIRWQTDDEISTVRKMENTYAGKAEKLEEALRPYHLAAHEYRFRSFFTWPGVWDICTFPKEDFSRELVKNIYLGAGVSIGDYDFEDLGFRDKDGNLWMKSCLHEGFFEMDLSEKQFAEFKRLEIPYEEIG